MNEECLEQEGLGIAENQQTGNCEPQLEQESPQCLYERIKGIEPEPGEFFFAFNKEQFAEGMQRTGLTTERVMRADGGLFGSKEGLDKFMDHYNALSQRIKDEIDPQVVYDYEYDNLECIVVGDDSQVMEIIIGLYGEEKAKTIVRKS